jgi:hypothetical protein
MTMVVVASILLAALVGGLVFTLLDSWQRRAAAADREPAFPPAGEYTWMSEARTAPLPREAPATRPPHDDDRSEERTVPLPRDHDDAPRRPLWDDPAHDDEDQPPGLWSGWAR